MIIAKQRSGETPVQELGKANHYTLRTTSIKRKDVSPLTKIELETMYSLMFTEYPDIVNISQVQSMLNVSRHLAYSLIGDGYIPGIKIGNAYRVPKINVIKYALSTGTTSTVS